MLDATSGDTETETRDYAIVVTLYCLGLRVSELCGLNLEETDLARGTAWIRGKGRRELVPLPAVVVAALRRYLAHRGATGQGPLFVTRSRRRGDGGSGRLQTRSVLRIVDDLGRRVGVRVWCHALRHTAITTAIERGQQLGVGLSPGAAATASLAEYTRQQAEERRAQRGSRQPASSSGSASRSVAGADRSTRSGCKNSEPSPVAAAAVLPNTC